MAARVPDEPARLEYERLAKYLTALANPSRLALLDQLQTPRPARALSASPARPDPHGSAGRSMSTVGIKGHLAPLQELGLVQALQERGERGAVLYALNHPKLYAVVEELRALGTLTSRAPLPGDATMRRGDVPGAPVIRTAGPRVVIVHGRSEGRVIPLTGRARKDRGWVIGRRPDLDVVLDYDPFVSQEHAEILSQRGGHALLDIRSNSNGTALNWEPMPRGGEAPLRTGDVIGLGRSLLLFRSD